MKCGTDALVTLWSGACNLLEVHLEGGREKEREVEWEEERERWAEWDQLIISLLVPFELLLFFSIYFKQNLLESSLAVSLVMPAAYFTNLTNMHISVYIKGLVKKKDGERASRNPVVDNAHFIHWISGVSFLFPSHLTLFVASRNVLLPAAIILLGTSNLSLYKAIFEIK